MTLIPAKVYIEPTSHCNLACRTCIRNVWDEPMGQMSSATFNRVLDGLRSGQTVFFGGYGEPLSHPHIIEMVRQVHDRGVMTELITNATLLDESMALKLIRAGLDRLWVSLDGATPDCYTDVRLGAALQTVLDHVARFRDLRDSGRPELGIVFVAMKRNIHDLPALARLAEDLQAARLMVTNVLPHTRELRDEILYARALSNGEFLRSPIHPLIDFPLIDDTELTHEPIIGAIRSAKRSGWHKPTRNRCPFMEKQAVAVGWDGSVSPCLALLHGHTSYLHAVERISRRYLVGNVKDRDLLTLWNDYADFRARVEQFDFSPCAMCDGCPLSETNESDCYGNTFPTCGGCLWAQGVVQCP
jgi:MoaA/NifB/PqqE/SkfB family radical SAM enzyme